MVQQIMTQVTAILCFLASVRASLGEIKGLQHQFMTQDNARLAGSVLTETSTASSAVRCSALCARRSRCLSFNYAKATRLCELNGETRRSDPGKLEVDARFKYYEIMNPKSENPTTEEPTTEKQTSEESTTLEANPASTEKPKTSEPASNEVTEGSTTREPTSEEPTTKEATTEESTPSNPTPGYTTTEKPKTTELTTEEPTTDEPTTMEPTTEEPDTVEPTTEEPTTEEPTTAEPTTQIFTTSASDPILESCSALRQAGFTTDGYYMIDPDGEDTGEDPFQVTCIEMANIGWTVVHHQTSGHVIEVTSDPYDVDIQYFASEEQIRALIGVSRSCQQTLEAECRNAHLWAGETQRAWWEAEDGTQMLNWGGVATGNKGCLCHGSCAGGNPAARCNCGGVPDEWASDGGLLNDITKLPVRALHFHDAGPPKELFYSLSALECVQKYPASG